MNTRFGLAGLSTLMAFRSGSKMFAYLLLMVLFSFLLASVFLLYHGMKEAATRGKGRLGADLMVVPKGINVPHDTGLFGGIPAQFSLPEGLEHGVAAMSGVARVAPQYVLTSAPDSCCEAGNLLLVGFDPSRDVTVLSWLAPGKRLTEGKQYILAGGAVLKARGAVTHLYNQAFVIADRLDTSSSRIFDNAVFIPLDGVKAMEAASRKGPGVRLNVPWERPSLLLVELDSTVTPRDVAHSLEHQFPAVQVAVISDHARDTKQRMAKHVQCLHRFLVAGALLAALAGGALQFLYWRERRQNLALLYAFGCTKVIILLWCGCETLFISLTGVLAGSLGALIVLRLIVPLLADITGMPLLENGIALSVSNLPFLLAVCAGTMAVGAVIAVLLQLRREPADLLRGI